jgi:hypothetical protein
MFSRSFIVLLIVAAFLVPALVSARDPQPTPLIRVVEPATAKAGEEVTVTGDNLGKDLVLEVYLTDRTDKTKVAVIEQNATTIKFKVPASIKPGKYWLMVLANFPEPLLIEEPARLMVE